MNIRPPSAPYVVNAPVPEKWCFRSPSSKDISNADWLLYSEDLPDLQSPDGLYLRTGGSAVTSCCRVTRLSRRAAA